MPADVSASPTGVHCARAALRELLSLTKETLCQVDVELNNGCRWSFWATTLNSASMPRILSSVWKRHSKNKYNHLKHTENIFSGSILKNHGRKLLFLQLIIKTSARNVNVLLPHVMRKSFSPCCGWNWFHFKILFWCPGLRSQISWVLSKIGTLFQAWIITYCEHVLHMIVIKVWIF